MAKRKGMSAAQALALPDLGEFEGCPIIGTKIDVPNIGGGFGMALDLDPVVMHKGERVKILVDAEVVQIAFPPVKDSDDVYRLHRLSAVTATFVEGDVFEEALEAHREKVAKAERDASGESSIDDALALQAEHDDGQHTELVDGCPGCVEEKEADARGD